MKENTYMKKLLNNKKFDRILIGSLAIFLIVELVLVSSVVFLKYLSVDHHGEEKENTRSATSIYGIYFEGQAAVDFVESEHISDDFKRGYLIGLLQPRDYPVSEEDENFIKVHLKYEEKGMDFKKAYNINNFPLQDDCLVEGLCFIKYN